MMTFVEDLINYNYTNKIIDTYFTPSDKVINLYNDLIVKYNIDINKTSIELTKEYQNDVENIYSKILEIKKFIDTVILTFS